MKKRKSCFIWLLCILLLVTALPAVDFTDVQAASVSSTFTGWKTYGGKKYYYKNGKKLTDLHKIGKYYYCFAADGTMLTGWHRIHNRFRYFGKQTGRMRINQTVNGRKDQQAKVSGLLLLYWIRGILLSLPAVMNLLVLVPVR